MKRLLFLLPSTLLIWNCSTTNLSMQSPSPLIEFKREDFKISQQHSAEASETKIIGIDFKRIFASKSASIGSNSPISSSSIPVIGNYISSFAKDYALYNLMSNNPGYDFVLYPQFKIKKTCPILGICILLQVNDVTATARLAGIKVNIESKSDVNTEKLNQNQIKTKSVKDIKSNTELSYFEKGFDYAKKGLHYSAIEYYTKSIQNGKNLRNSYFNRALSYSKLGKYNKELKDYDKVIKIDPAFTNAYRNRGLVKKSLGYPYCKDFKKACSMGDKKSCDLTKSLNCK